MSKNTAGDFLDNSYKDIDSAVSLDESQDAGGRDAGTTTEKKGGISQKMMIVGGVGVGALLLGGYWFLTGQQPQPAPVQNPEPAPQQAPAQPEQPPISFNEPAPTPAPVVPVAPVAQEVPVAPSLVPEAPVANNDLTIAAPSTVVMPEAVPQLSEPVQEVNPSNGEVAAILESAKNNPNEGSLLPSAQAPATQVAPVPAPVEPIQAIAANAPQTAHVDELRSLFDKHSVEIDKLDIRLTALEAKFDKSVQEQMAINKRVDERLAKLESGVGVKTVATSSNNSSSTNSAKADAPRVINNQRKRVKKASTNKQTTVTQTSKVTVQNEPTLDSTTLVDKRGVVAAAKPKQEAIEIHSVFSGRLWIKNPDSTLSTFAVGEAIPGGEKVKRIDEVSKKIYTDKRVISY